MRMELEVIEEGEEREETSRTTRSMQIETGDMTPMISTPIDSRMLPPSMIREVGLVGNSVKLLQYAALTPLATSKSLNYC